MIEKNLHYLSSDRKTKIHFHEWLPEGHVKAVVQVSHGITEHIGRYGELAYALVEKGYAVAGNDHLGHGESEKPECIVDFICQSNRQPGSQTGRRWEPKQTHTVAVFWHIQPLF
ncbi:MAG: alpha/beta hydrolase [Clostridiales bacterium]|nr:alpha/beta hydrolase [Clostridiales bacterium]